MDFQLTFIFCVFLYNFNKGLLCTYAKLASLHTRHKFNNGNEITYILVGKFLLSFAYCHLVFIYIIVSLFLILLLGDNKFCSNWLSVTLFAFSYPVSIFPQHPTYQSSNALPCSWHGVEGNYFTYNFLKIYFPKYIYWITPTHFLWYYEIQNECKWVFYTFKMSSNILGKFVNFLN